MYPSSIFVMRLGESGGHNQSIVGVVPTLHPQQMKKAEEAQGERLERVIGLYRQQSLQCVGFVDDGVVVENVNCRGEVTRPSRISYLANVFLVSSSSQSPQFTGQVYADPCRRMRSTL